MPRGAKRKRSAAAPAAASNKKAKSAKKGGGTASKPPAEYTRWLFKSEPESRIEKGVDVKFGLDDLEREEGGRACWDGVRNYQARNHMRSMSVGHRAFFYHSNCKVPGVAGLVEVCREHYPDHTQFDPADLHYDPKSDPADPRWSMVDVKFVRRLKRFVPLSELKALHLQHKAEGGGPLSRLALFTSARLSVQPLTEEEFDYIVALEDADPAAK